MNEAAIAISAAPQVLVVDDDPAMRTALETSFLRHGWRVETAAGASEAIVQVSPPPASRWWSPISACRMETALRSCARFAPASRAPAVILLTAYASVPGAVAAMKDGACDYLVKPVAFEQLERAAQQVLARTGRPPRRQPPQKRLRPKTKTASWDTRLPAASALCSGRDKWRQATLTS